MVQNLHDSKKPEQQSARTMNSEQFTCIVEAIVEGKYSWACVLILRFAGYNPAHYIPYRTYKRLLKENRRKQKVDVCKPDSDWSSAATEKNCSLQVMRHPALPETKEPSRT
ncbi:MAG TPA: HetP family heterocyst commitment protein, partial [Allocoleopsis sp.]